jgi:molybdopterin synthase catalytic subunit
MNAPIIVTGIVEGPIDAASYAAKIRRPDCGGLALFEGSTRSPSDGKVVRQLEYETWPERASQQLAAMAAEAVQRWDLGGAVAVHSSGVVPIGSSSVVVAAAAGHRDAAFAAARWMIDTLKAEAAIWKKEVFDDGEAWVGI